MERRRWPRKNDPESIRLRQDALRELVGVDGEVLWEDLQPWAKSQEAVTGVAVIPVSVVGPLELSLGDYELEEPFGRLVERVEASPALSSRAKLREVETHVVGPMCHVLWAFTTGDAVGPNMMTRNSYALNMGFVLEHAPVKPERVVLEANMGGDKKPSHRYFEAGGHGKTVIAECTLDERTVERGLRTTGDDLLDLSGAGTHGAVSSGVPA